MLIIKYNGSLLFVVSTFHKNFYTIDPLKGHGSSSPLLYTHVQEKFEDPPHMDKLLFLQGMKALHSGVTLPVTDITVKNLDNLKLDPKTKANACIQILQTFNKNCQKTIGA